MIEKVGFWRRGAAFLIDCIVVMFAIQLFAMALYPVTGGRVQTSGIIQSSQCQWPPAAGAMSFPKGEPKVPKGASITHRSHCKHSLFGWTYANYVIVSDQKKYGSATITRAAKVPLDTRGQGIWILWLDMVIIIVLLIYRSMAEARGGKSLGKRIVSAQVTANGDPAGARAWKRNLLCLLPIWPMQLLTDGPIFATPTLSGLSSTFTIVYLACLVIGLLWTLIAAIQIARRRDTWYDRFAGTSVVKTTQPEQQTPG